MSMKFIQLVDTAVIPVRATNASAGYDLFSLIEYKIYPGERILMSTGIAWENDPLDPRDLVGFIKPRSSLAHKHGIDVMAGVIDADYTHEIRVILINHGDAPVKLSSGSKIAQLVILNYETLGDANDFVRAGGFGSTDK